MAHIACSQKKKKEKEMQNTGGGPPTREYNPTEELALHSNEGCSYK